MRRTTLGLLALSLPWLSHLHHPAMAATLSQVIWGKNPDQPWGTKRDVTQADRIAIADYRANRHGAPIYATDFTSASEISSQWQLQSDDSWGLKSCRRPDNVLATDAGLRLETRLGSECQHAQWSTATMWSRARYRYGFFAAEIKIADINGFNNAFWLTTNEHFEIDAAEIHYPNIVSNVLHDWTGGHDHSVGFRSLFADYLPAAYHEFGVLWTPSALVFEVDGVAITAIATNGAVSGTADIRFSTALANFAGAIPDHPEGHDMRVKSLKVYALSP